MPSEVDAMVIEGRKEADRNVLSESVSVHELLVTMRTLKCYEDVVRWSSAE